jgi:hypothetical protein
MLLVLTVRIPKELNRGETLRTRNNFLCYGLLAGKLIKIYFSFMLRTCII